MGLNQDCVDQVKEEKKFDPGAVDVQMSNEPYIPNSNPQWQDRPFAKGYGIDFYLDGARFLPDNVTVTKAIIRVVTDEYVDVFKTIASLPRFGSEF